MKNEHKPKYPVYVISKGRFKGNQTAQFLIEDKVDFKLVVEPQEAEEYKKIWRTKNFSFAIFQFRSRVNTS